MKRALIIAALSLAALSPLMASPSDAWAEQPEDSIAAAAGDAEVLTAPEAERAKFVAIAIGIGAAVCCYATVTLIKPKLGYDDSLDVFGVHGIGGAWGAIATGLFIATWGVQDGVGWGAQIWKQIVSVAFTAVYAMGLSFIILKVLKAVMGDLRVDPENEHQGLDLSEHSETAYGPPS